ncbi:MAG: isoleucine--tRNA ligase [Coriobacteriales bacterium]|nr:isoleucine--tRNA ligase [Coriobacteriales bacterium]
MQPDYKSTMNLPRSDFPMRAGLAKSEPKRLQKWQDIDLYHQVLAQNAKNDSYILHDGPPYANGPLHMGHAFNKVLKDIIVKYKSQRGFYSPYVPGWDCHGQPIEHMVETTLGPEKMAQTDQPTLRRLCHDWARTYVDIQRAGFIRLGVTGEWDNPYLTYSPHYEVGNVEIFQKMYEAGAIYRGRKPIHWCAHCHTALAEAEIEYSDETSPSIYVAFRATLDDEVAQRAFGVTLEEAQQTFSGREGKAQRAFDVGENLYILIWTTTPWTLPANTAVTLAADADYVLLNLEDMPDKYLLVAEELADQVTADVGARNYTLIKGDDKQPLRVKGRDLLGLTYHHPIHDDMLGRVVTGSHVELGTGTGAVHTAPGHGQEDYQMGLEYDLPLLMPVDDNGVFDAGGGPFAGMNAQAANPEIISWLDARGTLVGQKTITHSYPHCWRCGLPVIFRATYQWFVSMESTALRAKALAALGTLDWYPTWAVNRMRSMLEDRPDWCISRQRAWGVPIPVFTCGVCGQTVATPETFAAVIRLFENEGADGWFTHEPQDYLPAGTTCPDCGAGVTKLLPERDILDVWWESGVSHTSVLRKRDYLAAPADLYLEGSDQHRGWFQSALLTSVGSYDTPPYKSIMSCGFIVDGHGHKMSKSRGNVLDPAQVIEQFGADVLRLWVGSIDYATDVGIDDEIIQRASESYRRIRNGFRFLLSNLYDFDFDHDAVDYANILAFDRWALVRLEGLLQKVTAAYDAMRFHVAYHAIYDYMVKDLSAIYLDALKDRLYSDAATSLRRRSAQTVLANILEVLVRVLAPILTFTCDEVWDEYPLGLRASKDDKPRVAAVQLAGWPVPGDLTPTVPRADAQIITADFALVLELREVVTQALEQARTAGIVGKSQEALLLIVAPPASIEVLSRLESGLLEEVLIVAEVKLRASEEYDTMRVEVSRAPGEKCPRCWNIRQLGTDSAHPDVCGRCAAVLAQQ